MAYRKIETAQPQLGKYVLAMKKDWTIPAVAKYSEKRITEFGTTYHFAIGDQLHHDVLYWEDLPPFQKPS